MFGYSSIYDKSMNGNKTISDGSGFTVTNNEMYVDKMEVSTFISLIGNLIVNNVYISPLTLSYLYGLTSNIQQQFNNIIANITTNTDDILINANNITTNADNIIINADNITANNNNLQDQIDIIMSNPNVETLTIGTVITLNPGTDATITYDELSTNTDIILNFGIPRGYQGQSIVGPQGERGERGKTGVGEDGKDGSDGDSTAATAMAITASVSATAAAAAAAASAAAATASAASASEAAASVAAVQTQVNAIKTDVATLNTEVTTLNTDVDTLQIKTQYQTATLGNTNFTSNIECANIIGNGTLYTAGNITTATAIIAPSFSGGLLSTNINGSVINIGDVVSIINLNGMVNFTNTNPFSVSSFFTQF